MIIYLTSAHSCYVTHIFINECRTLTITDCSVVLIVADGKSDEVKDKAKLSQMRRLS